MPKISLYQNTRLKSGVAAIAVICLVGCTASNETVETVEPTSIETSTDNTPTNSDTVVADEPVASEQSVTSSESADDERASDPTADSDMRQADSHVHGAASLALALDGETLSIEFESPLYNLVGFEHLPETDAQIAAVEAAETQLSHPSALILINPEARCGAQPVVGVDLMPEAEDAHDDDHHGSHDHDDEHDHDDHEHGDDHSHDHDHAHKDTLLSYSFSCQNPEQLQWIDIGLFETFDTLTEIDLVYLGPAQQISASLTPSSGRIQLVD